MTLENGQHILKDVYVIEELLGRGAFGEVYRATHVKLNTSRAIKILRADAPGVGSSQFNDYRKRFTLEFQTAARFDHPNIIKVYDLAEDVGVLYAVLEYAPNLSIKDLIDKERVVSAAQTAQILLDCAAGLGALHEQDIIHRDVKPANILLGRDGRAKIADLGLVQVNGGEMSMRSELGSAATIHPGTGNYRSPEHNSPEPVGPTADVYSLGCVAFEMLTGKPWKTAMRTVRSPRGVRGDVPEWLDQIVKRMLSQAPGLLVDDESNPEKRYVGMGQLTKALQEAQRQEAERIESQRVAEEARRIEAERIERERVAEESRRKEAERIERERVAEESRRKEAERIERERIAEESRRKEKERIEREQIAEEARRKEVERIERERIAEEARRKEAEQIESQRVAAAEAARVARAAQEQRDRVAARKAANPPVVSRRAVLIGGAVLASGAAIAGGGLIALLSRLTAPQVIYVQVTVAPKQPTESPATRAPSATAIPTVTPDLRNTATPVPTTAPATATLAAAANPLLLTLTPGVTIEMVRIPAGEFLMGSTDSNQSDEKPQHSVTLSDYLIGKYDVTNTQYAAYAQAKGLNWSMPAGKENHPVVSVNWDDAVAFCAWAAQVTGRNVKLPTEAQWEKAARGTDGRVYPWGNEAPDNTRANFNTGGTSPVGTYPTGKSPYGALDMAGNVWQWTSSLYKPYPYNPNDGREDQGSRETRVLRGGSWSYNSSDVRAAIRVGSYPNNRNDNNGFRVAVSAPGS